MTKKKTGKPKAPDKSKPKPLIEEIERFAEYQFTPDEVQALVGLEDFNDAQWLAYKRGRLRAEAEVRKSILHHAKAGSAPAQKSYLELVAKREKPKRGGRA